MNRLDCMDGERKGDWEGSPGVWRAGIRDRRGFSLIEAIVALAILAVVLGAVVPTFARNVRLNTDSELRGWAVAVAQEELDALRASGSWPASGSQQTVTAGEATFTSHLAYERYCQGSVCYDGARHVSLEVRHGGQTLYTVETVFTVLDGTTSEGGI
ncbi:MAG: type II secretion system protein [Gemmatimonadales bacterium]|nr:MAG: type II secretion system protein [Gemmatimonadales bacterium]